MRKLTRSPISSKNTSTSMRSRRSSRPRPDAIRSVSRTRAPGRRSRHRTRSRPFCVANVRSGTTSATQNEDEPLGVAVFCPAYTGGSLTGRPLAGTHMPPKRHADEVHVDDEILRSLLRAQFPQWADLPLTLVEPTGTDHTIYRIGSELVARMPIVPRATEQAAREAKWVPFLAPQVPLELPMPVAMGEPGEGYPLPWSI